MSLRHLLIRLPALFALLLELRMQLFRFVGKGLHEAGVADFAHEEVVEVTAWLVGTELERPMTGSHTVVGLQERLYMLP